MALHNFYLDLLSAFLHQRHWISIITIALIAASGFGYGITIIIRGVAFSDVAAVVHCTFRLLVVVRSAKCNAKNPNRKRG